MTMPWIPAQAAGAKAQKWFPEEDANALLAGERQRRTSAFELSFQGYESVELNGDRGRRTGSFGLAARTTVEFAGVRQRRTAQVDFLAGILGQLNGERARRSAFISAKTINPVVLSGERARREGSLQILEWRLAQLAGQRQRRTSAITIVPGARMAISELNGFRMRRTATIRVEPYASVTSLEAVRRRRLSQIEMDVSNDTPEDLANAGNIIRWVFRGDDGQFARVPINPREMSTPTQPRNMSWAWGAAPGAVMRGVDLGADRPAEWTFTGVLLTKQHYDLLSSWTRGLATVQITDHLNRTFETIIQRFDPIERLPTAAREWRADYTMTCLLLRRVA